jgi:hypothetical protein
MAEAQVSCGPTPSCSVGSRLAEAPLASVPRAGLKLDAWPGSTPREAEPPRPGRNASIGIFSIPKPFRGHIETIQRNAIESWMRLGSECEITLCGNEYGTAEVAREWNLIHVPKLAHNAFGTPFVNSALEQVQARSQCALLCYVNSDIILLRDFVDAAHRVNAQRFVMVGRRLDVDLSERWDFSQPDSEQRLRTLKAVPHSDWGMDFFVFPRRGTFDSWPNFLVGRAGWDNWIIFDARSRGIPVIDASSAICALHQNHDYAHVPQRQGERWVGPESDEQVQLLTRLMGGSNVRFAIIDATHVLTERGLHRALSPRALRRRWTTLPTLLPRSRLMVLAMSPLMLCADYLWRLLHKIQD